MNILHLYKYYISKWDFSIKNIFLTKQTEFKWILNYRIANTYMCYSEYNKSLERKYASMEEIEEIVMSDVYIDVDFEFG